MREKKKKMMNYFPDEVIEHIFDYVVSHSDRNALSLVCKSWYRIDRSIQQSREEARALNDGGGVTRLPHLNL